jgi:hypothetical protein
MDASLCLPLRENGKRELNQMLPNWVFGQTRDSKGHAKVTRLSRHRTETRALGKQRKAYVYMDGKKQQKSSACSDLIVNMMNRKKSKATATITEKKRPHINEKA